MRIAVCVLALAGSASMALADGSVLVWSTGNRDTTGDVASYLRASGCFDSVDWVNTNVTLPLTTLANYDRVLYFSNSSEGQDPTAIGDVLADYADTGRRLVLGVFSWAEQGGNTLGGRLISDGYSPFVSQGGSLYSTGTLGTTDGSFYWAGVNSLSEFYRDNVAVIGGATLHGSYADGVPLLATKGNVAALNTFVDYTWGGVSGDQQQLVINVLCNIPAPSTAAMAAAGMLLVGRRRR